MNINCVSALSLQPKNRNASNQTTKVMTTSMGNFEQPSKKSSISSKIALAQMPNVSFGKQFTYGKEELTDYENYVGGRPPEIEIKKYHISKQVQSAIENEDYLSAIKGKISLAYICKDQAKESDAYNLEDGVRRLYKDLPKYLKEQALKIIEDYNKDMAKHIEENIKNLL